MNIHISKNSKLAMAMLPVLMLLAGCVREKADSAPVEEAPKTTPVTYKTAAVQQLNPEYEISVPAELAPYEQVSIFARVGGFVKQMYVDRGSRVRKGQLLALLEAPEMDQRYLSDQSQEQKMYSDYLYAQQTYERLAEASATVGAVAETELERAKSAANSAKSAYEASKAGTAGTGQLQNYLRITAPFDGIITERNVSVGALVGVQSGPALFRIAQGDRLRLVLSLPEKHAASVQPDLRATFTVSSHPGKIFNTRLSRTSGLLDQQERSLTLEFDVPNSGGELQGGDYAQVKLALKRKTPTLWVPTKSLLNSQAGTSLMTITDDEIRRIPVREGVRLDTLTEVFGELTENDRFILKPSEEIKVGRISQQ